MGTHEVREPNAVFECQLKHRGTYAQTDTHTGFMMEHIVPET